jgi:hypothetical protein
MKSIIVFLFVLAICACTKDRNIQYIVLNAEQLKPLGMELNENGVFYKNLNPNWQQDSARFAGLGFYCCNDNYLTTLHFNESDTLKNTNLYDSLLIVKTFTKNDFYPLLIGDTKGNNSLENENLPADLKLLPVAIYMSDTKLQNRKDTLIVWFKPTESLKKALPLNIKMDDYLRTRVAKN